MNFYIYSITYFGNGLETEEEKGIMTASSYSDAMAEVDGWDLAIKEVRLREVCSEYKELDSEKPWISTKDLEEAFEEASIQLSSKSVHRCGCEEKDENPTPSCGEDCANDR